MSTAIVDGGRAGPDGAGGTYRNRVLTDRLVWWQALGARQGISYGASLSPVAGQMNLELAGPWLARVEERDAAGSANTNRGYVVWSDDTTVAAFDVASASDRMDALVIAFCDSSVGAAAFGTETSVVGGQVVVVPGVSGVTTARTDADIQAAVGSGGWVRVADVLVTSEDTEIAEDNIDLNPASDGRMPYVEVWHSGTSRNPGSRSVVSWSNVEETQGGVTVSGGTITLPGGLYQIDMSADARTSSGSWVAAYLADADTSAALIQGVSQRDGNIESVGFHRTLRVTDGQRVQVDLQAAGSTDIATEFSPGRDRFYFTARRVGD